MVGLSVRLLKVKEEAFCHLRFFDMANLSLFLIILAEGFSVILTEKECGTEPGV